MNDGIVSAGRNRTLFTLSSVAFVVSALAHPALTQFVLLLVPFSAAP